MSEHRPPPELKGSVMREVRREADLFAAVRAPERRAGAWRWRVPSFAVATAAACGLAVGLLVVDEGGAPESRTVAAQVSAGAPARASGSLTLGEDGARLRVRGLPAPGPNRVYQVWVQGAGGSVRPTEALFDVGHDGVGATVVPGPLRRGERVLVSSEPAGGSSRPTREPVLGATV